MCSSESLPLYARQPRAVPYRNRDRPETGHDPSSILSRVFSHSRLDRSSTASMLQFLSWRRFNWHMGKLYEKLAMNPRCSVFLLVMLHWEAAFGGAMPNASTAAVDGDLVETLDQKWSFVGEVNGLRAYNRTGSAICFLKWEDGWRVFAGFTSAAAIKSVASELGVAWESPA